MNYKTYRFTNVITEKMFLLTSISAMLSYFSWTFVEPILAIRLTEFDLTPLQIGIFFSAGPICYTVSNIFAPWFADRLDNKILI